MSNYTKPTVTKIGAISVKTEGGWNPQDMEVYSRRGGCSGGN